MKRVYLLTLGLVTFLALSFGLVLPKLLSMGADEGVLVGLAYLALVVPYVSAYFMSKLFFTVKGLLK